MRRSNGVFLSGDDVTGNIQSYEEELTKVTILENGSAIKTYTSFKSLPIMGQSGLYSIIISGLSDGSYTMRAESKTGETSANFTIGAEYESFELSIGGGESTAGSYISIKDKKVYTTAEAKNNAAAIEMIFDGTTIKSASESINTSFTPIASATVSQNGNVFTFSTSTNYEGTITVNGTLGDPKAIYTVNVKRAKK